MAATFVGLRAPTAPTPTAVLGVACSAISTALAQFVSEPFRVTARRAARRARLEIEMQDLPIDNGEAASRCHDAHAEFGFAGAVSSTST